MSILSQQKQSVNTDFPNIRPSLDLRFALAKELDPRVTFTRGSTGTYFGPDGLMRTAAANEPRFDHDPVTGQSLGLMIEESRQNLLTYSEDFTQGVWTKHNTSVNSNVITSPNNTNTATKLIENTSRTQHMLFRNLTSSVNQAYTFSFFAKSAERNYVLASFSGGGLSGDCVVGVSLIDGSITTTSNSPENTSVTKLPNGWYKITLTKTTPSASAFQPRILISPDGSSSQVYQGDGTSGIYVWGAQLETGSLPTSYIPTVASTVTRSADNASMTGTNFSSWYNQSEGTIYLETDKIYSGNFDTYRHYYSFSNGTGSNNITIYTLPSTTLITNYGMANGGRQVFDYQTINVGSAPTTFKLGQSVNTKYSLFTSSKQRIPPQLPSRSEPNGHNLSIPTNLTQLGIGCEYYSSFIKHINSHISRFTYYPIQITNQQLINLTS